MNFPSFFSLWLHEKDIKGDNILSLSVFLTMYGYKKAGRKIGAIIKTGSCCDGDAR